MAYPSGSPEVLVGSGNDVDATVGGYQAYAASGAPLWFTPVVNPPTDADPDTGVQAGLAVGTLQGPSDLFAGSLGQVAYALNAANGATLTGWPFFDSDSTHSTAALADLYGTGQNEIIVGGRPVGGLRAGPGVHQRRSPAHPDVPRATRSAGPTPTRWWTRRRPSAASWPAGPPASSSGPGDYFAGASDTDTLKAYDNQCNQEWSTTLDGSTYSSPALSDVLGNGSLQVIEGTDQGPGGSGSVYVLNAATGQDHLAGDRHRPGHRLGGHRRPHRRRLRRRDRPHHQRDPGLRRPDRDQEIADLSPNLGLQNSPLVTAGPQRHDRDHPGRLHRRRPVTERGRRDRPLRDPGSNGAEAVGAGAWPMFHHDPQLTGDAGGTTPIGSMSAVLGAGGRLLRLHPEPPPTAGSSPSASGRSAARPAALVLNAPDRGGGHGPVDRRVLGGGVRRRGLRLRRGPVLRLRGGKAAERSHRRHGRHPGREGLLAGGLRRRDLRLRRRPVLRIRGRKAPQQADRGDRLVHRRQGLPTGGLRRRHLHLRGRPVLRLDGGRRS